MKFLARFSTQVCAALMVSVSPWCSGQTSYSITDLGTIHTNGYRVARDVNIAGEVTAAAGSCSMNLSEVFL